MLCYCIQIEFTSLVRIETLCLLYLLSVVEAGCCFLVSFSRVSSVLCSDVTWSVRAPSGNLCCVTSPGKLSSAVVASWCYGIGTVLDFINGWFSRWESSGPARVGGRSFAEFQRCSSHVRESREEKRASAPLARRFKQTNLALPTGGLSNPIVRMGRSPACTAVFFLQGIFMWRQITCFYPCIKTLTRFTHL